MASPKIEVIFIYDSDGEPLEGQVPSFETYKDDLGADLVQPVVTEIGGGAYKFTPSFPTDRGIVYVLNTDTGGNPTRIAKFMRPEDFNLDNCDVLTSSVDASGSLTIEPKIDELLQIQKGKWEIKTIGEDANRLIIYEADGSTVLQKFDLADKDGLPTSINPFKRTPA
jgi:hypothetical protein